MIAVVSCFLGFPVYGGRQPAAAIPNSYYSLISFVFMNVLSFWSWNGSCIVGIVLH